jgi:hypothetical protein
MKIINPWNLEHRNTSPYPNPLGTEIPLLGNQLSIPPASGSRARWSLLAVAADSIRLPANDSLLRDIEELPPRVVAHLQITFNSGFRFCPAGAVI